MSDDTGLRDTVDDHVDSLTSGVRFGKFASVGVVGAMFDVTTATALNELNVFPELAVFIGIEVAVIVMFLLNDNWTFSEQGAGGILPTLKRLARSNVVRAGGILVQLGTFWVVFRVIALDLDLLGIDAWFVFAKVTGIGVGMVVNYVAESLFTWRVQHD
ncbi:GtrA family protein [Haloarchaeobius sp. DYHT-AS-18]|uniref:GtrA family protein n=1 Tax=Haloarchaeobius sp. DYHT-AS-18 TaxID=3446117 RepID=UPI003EB9FCF0